MGTFSAVQDKAVTDITFGVASACWGTMTHMYRPLLVLVFSTTLGGHVSANALDHRRQQDETQDA